MDTVEQTDAIILFEPVRVYDLELSPRVRNALCRKYARIDEEYGFRWGYVCDLYNDPKPPRGLGRKGIFELNRVLVKIGYRKIWENF